MISEAHGTFFLRCIGLVIYLFNSKSTSLVHVFSVSILLSGQSLANTQDASVSVDDISRHVVETVYQPGHEDFARKTEIFLLDAQQGCQRRTNGSLLVLRDRFKDLVFAFSGVELFRAGPLLEENRQNRLFFWPDKRRAGERQLRALLQNADSSRLSENQLSGKSVALQGIPAVERLLFGEYVTMHVSSKTNVRYCHLATVIAQNMNSMANALSAGWHSESEFVKSMRKPEADSDYFRTEDEVLRSIVTQIIVGIDVVLNRKIAPLIGKDARWKNAPLWLSEQTIPMIKGNMNSLQALIVDSGLARITGLENELSFEFRTANTMLKALEELPSLIDDGGHLNEDAQSLIRSLAAVADGIASTLNDRFLQRLGISAGFNSEDGD